MEYKYSVSIPHYNSPDLLKRMLASIPERDDIQVIVVDDGSNAEAVEKLKQLRHKNLELVLQPQNYGGGYERNVGLSKATGRWFISVDADDFFSKDAFDVFDENVSDDIDVLMFCISTAKEDGSPSSYIPRANKSVLNYLEKKCKKTEDKIRFYNLETWNKLVSMEFIRRENIVYENCRVNIDVYYSLQIGLKANHIKVIPNKLYNWVINEGSITQKKRTIEREFIFYLQVQKRNGFYKEKGLTYAPYYRPDWLYIPHMIRKYGIKGCYEFFSYRHNKLEEVRTARKAYLHLLNNI